MDPPETIGHLNLTEALVDGEANPRMKPMRRTQVIPL